MEYVIRTNIPALLTELEELGAVRFRQRYGRPALVGVGRAVDAEEEDDFEGRTMIVSVAHRQPANAPGPQEPPATEQGSVTDLVFLIPYSTIPVRLGRIAGKTDIVIADYSVSAMHCELRWIRHDRLGLANTGARNAVWVSQRELQPQEVVALRGGEEIVLGRLVFRYVLPDALLALIQARRRPPPASARR